MENQTPNLKTLIASSFKGYQKPVEVQMMYFEKVVANLARFKEAFKTMLNEQFLFDDAWRGDIEQFLVFLATKNDTLICTEDGKVIGIAIFANVIPGRCADFIGWVHPDYRTGAFSTQKKVKSFVEEDILDHAWNVLQLAKLQARIINSNSASLSFAENVGFKKVGELSMDFRIFGQFYDSVLFELVNPIYQLDPIEEKTHGWKRTETRSDGDGDDDESFAADDDSAGEFTDSRGSSDESGTTDRPRAGHREETEQIRA